MMRLLFDAPEFFVAARVRLDYIRAQAPIAQLDRALPSEGRGRRFESYWVRHFAFVAENVT